MTVLAGSLHYPLLCLTRQMGVCIVRSAFELERRDAAAFWQGRFFEGLRLVDAEGQTHEVVRATIRRPASSLGQRMARLLALPVSVEVEVRAATDASLEDVRQAIEKAIEEDAEGFEEFSGHSVDWWNRCLVGREGMADLMQILRAQRA